MKRTVWLRIAGFVVLGIVAGRLLGYGLGKGIAATSTTRAPPPAPVVLDVPHPFKEPPQAAPVAAVDPAAQTNTQREADLRALQPRTASARGRIRR